MRPERSISAAELQTRARDGAPRGPPPVPFVLAVGVTGHRADVLPEGSISLLGERVRDVLQRIEESGRALLEAERDCFAHFPPKLRFVSPSATRV